MVDEAGDSSVGAAGENWIDFAELQRQMKLEAARVASASSRGGGGGRVGGDAIGYLMARSSAPSSQLSVSSREEEKLAHEKEQRRAERDARRAEREARRQQREQQQTERDAQKLAKQQNKESRQVAKALLAQSAAAFAAADWYSAEHFARQAHATCAESHCLLSLANVIAAGPERQGVTGHRLPDAAAAARLYQQIIHSQQIIQDPSVNARSIHALAAERLSALNLQPWDRARAVLGTTLGTSAYPLPPPMTPSAALSTTMPMSAPSPMPSPMPQPMSPPSTHSGGYSGAFGGAGAGAAGYFPPPSPYTMPPPAPSSWGMTQSPQHPHVPYAPQHPYAPYAMPPQGYSHPFPQLHSQHHAYGQPPPVFPPGYGPMSGMPLPSSYGQQPPPSPYAPPQQPQPQPQLSYRPGPESFRAYGGSPFAYHGAYASLGQDFRQVL